MPHVLPRLLTNTKICCVHMYVFVCVLWTQPICFKYIPADACNIHSTWGVCIGLCKCTRGWARMIRYIYIYIYIYICVIHSQTYVVSPCVKVDSSSSITIQSHECIFIFQSELLSTQGAKYICAHTSFLKCSSISATAWSHVRTDLTIFALGASRGLPLWSLTNSRMTWVQGV